MSEKLYESMLGRWKDFLDDEFWPCSSEMTEDTADDEYDNAVDDFCKKYRYSNRTKEFAFYDRWWDTFKDEYYQKLETLGVVILHNAPQSSEKGSGKAAPRPPEEAEDFRGDYEYAKEHESPSEDEIEVS